MFPIPGRPPQKVESNTKGADTGIIIACVAAIIAVGILVGVAIYVYRRTGRNISSSQFELKRKF